MKGRWCRGGEVWGKKIRELVRYRGPRLAILPCKLLKGKV